MTAANHETTVTRWLVIADCNQTTSVSDHDTSAAALDALAFIDRIGCGSRCTRDHSLVHLGDPGGR